MKRKLLLIASLLLTASYGYTQENEIPEEGNVGIGTTQPTEKLDVRGGARIDSTLNLGDSIVVRTSARVGEDLRVEGNAYFAQNLSVVGLSTLSNTLINGSLSLPNLPLMDIRDVVIVDQTGQVGKINGSTLAYASYKEPVTLACNPTNSNPTWANGVNKIYVKCPEVKVGIGTTEPSHNLQVTGDSRFDNHSYFGSSISLGVADAGFGKLAIKNTTNAAAIHINQVGNNSAYSKLLFLEYNNSTTEILKVHNTATNYDAFLLTSGGGMTINNGTTKTLELKPDGQLILQNATGKTFQFDVDGKFRARRVRVDAETWADFVFESDYNLMPLTEVKEYVVANKHLPSIPSEKELANEGIDLAEMNKLLMQKIEELTLYLIDQHEDAADSKEEIKALKADISTLKVKMIELESSK